MLQLDIMTSAISTYGTFLDSYILLEQTVNFACQYVVSGPHRMNVAKISDFGIFNFRNLFVLHSFKHCKSTRRRVFKFPHHSQKE